MIVAEFDVLPCNMPQSDPGWRFSIHANRISKGWLVRLTSDTGVVGYGYASATRHMGASAEGLRGALEAFAPFVVGKDPFDIEAILAALDHELAGINQAKAAIDCALHEIVARSLDLPLNALFGGRLRTEVPVMRVLSIKSADEMAARAQELLDAGYRFIKIKVDGHVGDDFERVRAIRDVVGPDIRLTIDANQAYAPKDAIRIANLVADLGVEIFEQPVTADDHEGLKLVTDNTAITIEADESAASLREVMKLVAGRIVDGVSLKVSKLGGLRNTVAAARICQAGRVRCRFGAHVGPRLMSAQAAHLAAGLAGLDFACEFGEFVRLTNDPTEGIENIDGQVTVPPGPGSGASLKPEAEEAGSDAYPMPADA
ncbi:MAG: enolase C-terminal domain-like protein [Alphaproteobacteria bacterium]|nr:enolase C-terminal domain-like protein [Alphaproteobacteria bacterium]